MSRFWSMCLLLRFTCRFHRSGMFGLLKLTIDVNLVIMLRMEACLLSFLNSVVGFVKFYKKMGL